MIRRESEQSILGVFRRPHAVKSVLQQDPRFSPLGGLMLVLAAGPVMAGIPANVTDIV